MDLSHGDVSVLADLWKQTHHTSGRCWQKERPNLCRGKWAEGKSNSTQLCWESQTTPKHRVKGRDKLWSGSSEWVWAPYRPVWVLSRMDWVFWESRARRKVGVRRLEWRNTVENNFSASYGHSDVSRARLSERPTHQWDFFSQTMTDICKLWTDIPPLKSAFSVSVSPQIYLQANQRYTLSIYALCIFQCMHMYLSILMAS